MGLHVAWLVEQSLVTKSDGLSKPARVCIPLEHTTLHTKHAQTPFSGQQS